VLQTLLTSWLLFIPQVKDVEPLHRAARYLMSAQLPSGDWPQQHISGVFNRNCMITYANYR
jgi:cycloartenol synthase